MHQVGSWALDHWDRRYANAIRAGEERRVLWDFLAIGRVSPSLDIL